MSALLIVCLHVRSTFPQTTKPSQVSTAHPTDAFGKCIWNGMHLNMQSLELVVWIHSKNCELACRKKLLI